MNLVYCQTDDVACTTYVRNPNYLKVCVTQKLSEIQSLRDRSYGDFQPGLKFQLVKPS